MISLNRTGALLVLGAVAVCAQQPLQTYAIPQRGIVPLGFYEISKIEAIDTTSGNLSLHIPLTALPAGRAGFSTALDLFYNSSMYLTKTTYPETTGLPIVYTLVESDFVDPFDTGGWHYGFRYTFVADYSPDSSTCSTGDGIGDFFSTVKYRIVLPDGSSHTLYMSGAGDVLGGGYYQYSTSTCSHPVQGGTPTLYTADGTYLRMAWNPSSGAWTLYSPDGRVVQGTGAQLLGDYGFGRSGFVANATDLFDRNANHIQIQEVTSADGTLTTTLMDDFNRTITIQHPPTGDDTIQQLGYPVQNPSQPSTQPLTWTIKHANNSLPDDVAHSYPCGQGTCSGAGMGTQVVSSIILPNSQQYQFCYDGAAIQATGCLNVNPTQWGLLSLIKLPTGASVRYVYPTQPALSTTSAVNFPLSSKTLTWIDENDSAGPQRVETSTFSFTPTQSAFTHPDGEGVTHFFYDTRNAGAAAGLVYKTVNAVSGDVLEQIWKTNAPYGTSSSLPGNPFVQTELRSVGPSGNPSLTAARVYSYDRNGNQTQLQEYDWIPYNANNATSFSGGTPLRTTTTQYVNGATGSVNGDVSANLPLAGSSTADPHGYWNVLSTSTSPQLTNLVYQTSVLGSSANVQFAYDGNAYGASYALTHGNLTSERRFDSNAGQYVQQTHAYDSFGNMTSTANPRGFTTQYSYDSTKTTACPSSVATPSNLYVSQIVQAFGTTDARTFQFTHDCMTGVTGSDLDSDHQINRTYTYDQFSRLATVQEGSVRKTSINYQDLAREIDSYSDLSANGDQLLVQKTFYDQLGRVRKTQDPAGNQAQTRYMTPSGTGFSYELTSNPYVTQAEDTMGWTLTQRDTDGRTVSVDHFKGAVLPKPWVTDSNAPSTGKAVLTYAANAADNTYCATSADEAAVSHASCTDGLGRLKKVTETGIGATTFYGYDTLDDLTCVTQGGTVANGICQNGMLRTFTYSSLKQLLTATNPESGLATYTYDPNGNVSTRADARGTTNYGYNGLDQIKSKTYNDAATPDVTYGYTAGWLTQVQSSASTYNYTNFDGIGRVTGANQFTANQTYPFVVQYKPTVGVSSIQYPGSNRTITTNYDSFGRPSSVSGQSGAGPTSYVGDSSHPISYAPHGGIASLSLGIGSSLPNGLPVSTLYNSRLQVNQIQAGAGTLTIGYCYRAGDCSTQSTQAQNNGNVLQQTITRSGTIWTDNYKYDGVNRLTDSGETGAGTWSQSNCYDTLGNRWVVDALGTGLTLSQETPKESSCAGPGPYNGNNQFTGLSYDEPHGSGTVNRGNVTQVASMARSFAYDAENRMISTIINNQTSTYSYDGDGRRVQKVTPNGTTIFVYDPFGDLAQEYGPSSGQSSTQYLIPDALGSTRLVVDSTGATVRCYDYLPFGEELGNGTAGRTAACFGSGTYPEATPDAVSEKFTGKERDAETGLDFFEARYFSGAQGRFTSVDPLLASGITQEPQSWNRYAYGLTNPFKYGDPTGMQWTKNDAGDREWVDGCGAIPSYADCNTAVAVQTTTGVTVYGSQGADDITEYKANKAGVVDVGEIAQHHDANFIIGPQQVAENFLSPQAAVALFNVAENYGKTTWGDGPLVFTGGSAETGKPGVCGGKPCHTSHQGGANIDLRYMGTNGQSLVGDASAKTGDIDRNRGVMNLFYNQHAGLGSVLTGVPERYQSKSISDPQLLWIHRNHMHFQRR